MSKKSKVIAVGHKYIPQEGEGAGKKKKKKNTQNCNKKKKRKEKTSRNALPLALLCIISNPQRRACETSWKPFCSEGEGCLTDFLIAEWSGVGENASYLGV